MKQPISKELIEDFCRSRSLVISGYEELGCGLEPESPEKTIYFNVVPQLDCWTILPVWMEILRVHCAMKLIYCSVRTHDYNGNLILVEEL